MPTYWADESARGREEGSKDRPAIVLALSILTEMSRVRVLVVAVTHTAPRNDADAVLFPADLKRSIGLDDRPAWIITTEGNAFIWPGPDVRPIPRRNPRTVVYGSVPADFMQRIAVSYIANRARQLGRIIPRTD